MLVAAVSALAFGVAAPAAAASTPCWRQVIDEWVKTDRIASTYPLHCYRDAIGHIPEDMLIYSSIEPDIRSAMQLAARRGNARIPAAHNPTASANKNRAPDRALFAKAFDKLGPRNVNSVPLPLMILAGLSLLLIAAGAAGLVSRRMRTRKVPG